MRYLWSVMKCYWQISSCEYLDCWFSAFNKIKMAPLSFVSQIEKYLGFYFIFLMFRFMHFRSHIKVDSNILSPCTAILVLWNKLHFWINFTNPLAQRCTAHRHCCKDCSHTCPSARTVAAEFLVLLEVTVFDDRPIQWNAATKPLNPSPFSTSHVRHVSFIG